MSAIGVAYDLIRLYREGLDYLDRSLKLAASDPERGFQYITLHGKVSALNGDGRTEEAWARANEVVARALASHKNANLCVALISRARLFREQKDNQRVLESLGEAIDLAGKAAFHGSWRPRVSCSRKRKLWATWTRRRRLPIQVAEATRHTGDLYSSRIDCTHWQ
jgi:hypothetical protein